MLFPSVNFRSDNIRRCEAILEENGKIVWTKNVHFKNDGPTNLMREIYTEEEWLGNYENKFKGARKKAELCSKKPKYFFLGSEYPVRFFIVEFDSLDIATKTKEEIRNLFDLGNHSVHINDTHEETVRVANIAFNDNSIHFLNNSQIKNYSRFFRLLDQYKKWLAENALDQECFCIDASAVMAVYGIREARDVDFLHSGYDGITTDIEKVGSHNDWSEHYPTSIDNLVFNPENYFYHQNLKFTTLDILSQMKENRNEKKDRVDVKLIRKLLKKRWPYLDWSGLLRPGMSRMSGSSRIPAGGLIEKRTRRV